MSGTIYPSGDELYPDPATGRLARALASAAPTPDWPVATHRDAFVEAVRGRSLAEGVTVERHAVEGVDCETASPTAAGTTTILYVHGGGYIMGTLETTRPLASQLATATGARVLYPEYRLAPEHPFPAALDDVSSVYRYLLDSPSTGQIVVAGDSAGGGLALAMLLRARDLGLPQPVACVFISPWVDLTLSAASIEANAPTEPQAPRWLLERMAAAYLAGSDPTNPDASPLYADLRGLPPLLLQVGGLEGLLDDSLMLAGRAASAGVDVTLRVWRGAIHVWHAFAPRLLLANQAFVEVGAWLGPRLTASSRA